MKMNGNKCGIINVDLDSRDEYINKYDDDKLCEDLHNYIIDSAVKMEGVRKIDILVSFNYFVTWKEKERVRKLIRDDIEVGVRNKVIVNKRNMVRDGSFIFIGIICIVISFLFKYLGVNIISEVVLIVGWFFIWEIINNILFVETDERVKKRKYMQLARGKIVFK